MADGWAQFSTTEAKEEQDDDWGDFGGFETAQPVTDPAASNTSGVISWATTFSTQPSPAEQNSVNDSPLPDLRQGTQFAAVSSEIKVGDPALEATVEQDQETPNWLSSAAPPGTKSNSQPQAYTSSLSNTTFGNTATSNKQQSEITENAESDGSSQKHIEEAKDTAKAINDLKGKLSLAEQDKLELREELENLLAKQKDVSKTTQEMLEEQRQKYANLQEEHHQQLHDMRQAGHDTLSLIVEEYKELSKQAVLEEREKNQAELHNFLEDERRKFKQILTQQQESFERMLAEEKEKNDERVKTVIEEEQQKQKLAIEFALNKEREKFKETLEVAIKETREQNDEAIKAAVSKEKEMHLALMEKMENTMEEEREKFRTSIKDALDNERQESKKAIQEVMQEERTKSRETVNESVKETKYSMTEYIRQKEEIDAQIRQKQYVVMDLFLESARTQLKNLIESDQKN